MVIIVRLTFVAGAVAALQAWYVGMVWLCPWLAGAACVALIASALLDAATSAAESSPDASLRAACAPLRLA